MNRRSELTIVFVLVVYLEHCQRYVESRSAVGNLPGRALRSPSSTAASKRSSLSRGARSIPENALIRLPEAKSLVRNIPGPKGDVIRLQGYL